MTLKQSIKMGISDDSPVFCSYALNPFACINSGEGKAAATSATSVTAATSVAASAAATAAMASTKQ
jgi:hypothetical protein